MVRYVKINACSVEARFKGFDETWGAKNVLCRYDKFDNHLELETSTYVGSLTLWLTLCLITWWLGGGHWVVG